MSTMRGPRKLYGHMTSHSQRQPHVRRVRQGLGTCCKRAIVYERLGLTVVDDVSGLLAVEMKVGRCHADTRSHGGVVGLHEGRSILEHHGDSITRPNAIGLEESGKLISPGVELSPGVLLELRRDRGCVRLPIGMPSERHAMQCCRFQIAGARVETGHCSLHRFLSQR